MGQDTKLLNISTTKQTFSIFNTDYVSSWKSKGLSAENIRLTTTSNNSLTPALKSCCWKLFKTT